MRTYTVPDGMPRSVFESKYSRPRKDGKLQTYAERITEVIDGNYLLDPRDEKLYEDERFRMRELAVAGVIPTSGRHLQHGDADQLNRGMELHTNCSTAIFSFMLFRLLLRGSGVGRDYSSASCRVDWANMPDIRLCLDSDHDDFTYSKFRGFFQPLREARHMYDPESERVRWFRVGDSREGWSKVVEILETAAWQEKHRDKLFIFDFSDVRKEGAPIMGLQGRPASGPLSIMEALARVGHIKGSDMRPWKQALFIDHALAECVQWGGARRSARMSTKIWRDRDVIEFIDIKRGGFLWSSNNSILVDEEFWEKARQPQHSHARRVFEAATNAAYFDGTGEPGFINVDKLCDNREGMDTVTGKTYIDTSVYPDLHPRTMDMIDNVLEHIKRIAIPFIVNPCGEIVLATYGAYCVIGDICLAQVEILEEAIEAAGMLAKFLVRTNRMKCEYRAEVDRTNRIGVAITGIHEFAFKHFGLTFRQMIDYPIFGTDSKSRAHKFWQFIDLLRQTVEAAATELSIELHMNIPHTFTTIKPSGTISKVMTCTEGAHLPAQAYYLRWNQYKFGDRDLEILKTRGYPIKDISHRYSGHCIVGFPTKMPIVDLMGDKVTTAQEATPTEQYIWVCLLERFWMGGEKKNNQVSYTLKYDPRMTSYTQFMELVLDWQPLVRCISVLPAADWEETEKIYSYVPEQPITAEEYHALMASIKPVSHEGFNEEDLACESGVCPIEPSLRTISITENST